MTFDKMNSETCYIQAKHFTNQKCLEMEDMASITLKLIFTEKSANFKGIQSKTKTKVFSC